MARAVKEAHPDRRPLRRAGGWDMGLRELGF